MLNTAIPFAILALFGLTALYIQAKMILRQARLLEKTLDHLKEASERSYNYGMSNLPARSDMPEFIPWGDGSGAGFVRQPDGSYLPLGADGERLPNPFGSRVGGVRSTVSETEGVFPEGFELEEERI